MRKIQLSKELKEAAREQRSTLIAIDKGSHKAEVVRSRAAERADELERECLRLQVECEELRAERDRYKAERDDVIKYVEGLK